MIKYYFLKIVIYFFYRVALAENELVQNPLFAPGRMAYIIDLTEDITDTDIPTTLIRSKSDVPSMDDRPTLTTNDIVINKLAQILSYLRTGPKHLKKSKRRDKQVFDDNIYPELPDYEPSTHKRSEETTKKQSNYFKNSKDEEQEVEKEHHKRDEMGWVNIFILIVLNIYVKQSCLIDFQVDLI